MENMTLNFEQAMAEIIPFHLPEVLSWKTEDGELEFAVPGWDVTSREYLVAASLHKAPWPANLDFPRIFGNAPNDADDHVSGYTFSFQFAQYLLARGDSRVHDWQTLMDNSKYYSDAKRAAMTNWANKAIDVRTEDTTFTMKRRDVMRMVMLKVLEQNDIDVFVNPPIATIPSILGGARDPARGSHGYGARLGVPEVFVPAGFATTNYEPALVLNEARTEYVSVAGTEKVTLANPMPFNIAFWAGPGEEAVVLEVASAYEAATHHRAPPPAFGPVKGGS
jgi:Asp-tRNA(Asn)/Glu-tRNA(Gln) amidotransferase A subunit family amidase